MDALRTNWYLVCVVVLVVGTGFVGVGASQQTANATANTTTSTAVQGTQTAESTATALPTTRRPVSPSSTGRTVSTRSPITTPDTNDVWRNATPIETGRTVNGTLPVGDQDWHLFTLESSGTITVRLAAANQTNMSGFLYSSEGNLLDSSYVPPGGQISLTGTAPSAGNYYVFVRNEANNTPGAYAFVVSVSQHTAPADEGQPQAEGTSGGSGPGFGLLAGFVSVVVGAYLRVRRRANSD